MQLNKEQFLEECVFQITRCEALNAMIQVSNAGKPLVSFFPPSHVEVWHTWKFPSSSANNGNSSRDSRVVTSDLPKWVSSFHTQPFLPNASTSFDNLVLAGAHTNTNWPIWSMEGATESGRRAAFLVDDHVQPVIPQTQLVLARPFKAADGLLNDLGMPNIVDVLAFLIVIVILVLLGKWLQRKNSKIATRPAFIPFGNARE
jgi:Flavin containing amine oxidoreductase